MKKIKKYPLLIFSICIFVFAFLYFTKIHPIVIYDGDDWLYMSYYRKFMPIWQFVNPAKVLPDTLEPLCGTIAAYLVYPISGDYIGSFTIVYAIVVSIFISLYITMFAKMIKEVFKLANSSSIMIALMFFFIHFILLLVQYGNNKWLFMATNTNCYFNYVIPNLFNFSIVFYLIATKKGNYSISLKNPLKTGLYFLILFLAIFSNLYCNIILAIYAGTELLFNVLKSIKKKPKFRKIIKDNALLILILFMWCVAAFYEYNGGRAAMVPSGNFANELLITLQNLKFTLFNSMNSKIIVAFFIIVGGVILDLIVKRIKKKNKFEYSEIFLKLIICYFLAIIYYTLLCAKVNPNYMFHIDYIFGIYAYFLILIFLCICYITSKYSKILIIFPYLIAFLIVEVNIDSNRLRESNITNVNPIICKAIDEDLIKQIQEAINNGDEIVQLHVPVNSSREDNWPHATWMKYVIGNTLYNHDIIYKNISIEIVPDAKMNIKYNIN